MNNKEDISSDEWEEKISDELYSLQNQSGLKKLSTDECDILSESIYENIIAPFQQRIKDLEKERDEALEKIIRLATENQKLKAGSK